MKIAFFDPHRDPAEFSNAMRAYPSIEYANAADAEQLPAALKDAEVLITSNRIYTPENAAIIRLHGTSLRWIQMTTSGHDKAVASGFPDGCVVTNMAGLRAFAVAEHAMALTLALVRRLRDIEREFSARRWSRDELSPFMDNLAGKHMTIVGVGAIGQDIARKAKAFDMQVTGVTRKPAPLPNFDAMRPRAEMQAQCRQTDILMIAAVADPQTQKMISREIINALPARAMIVNIARGSLIDEPALIDALQTKRIAGAALDVQAEEPTPAAHPLWALDNLLLSPHVGGAGSNGLGATHASMFTDNLDLWLAGKPLKQVVIEKT